MRTFLCLLGLMLLATSLAAADGFPLADHHYAIVEVNQKAVPVVPDMRPLELTFSVAESSVSGCAGVNRISGTYAIAKQTLTVGPMISTMMAGPDEAMLLESTVLTILGKPLAITQSERGVLLTSDQGTILIK